MSTSSAPMSVSPVDGGLAVSGEIDAHTAPELADAIGAYSDTTLTLDLSGVEFVDSSGLRVLIESHQQLEQDGRQLRIASPSASVRRLFEISGVDSYLHVD